MKLHDWWLGAILIGFVAFKPLAMPLLRMTNHLEAIRQAMEQLSAMVSVAEHLMLATCMAMTVVKDGLIMLVYPFIQRYFTNGLQLGSIRS